MYLYTIKAMKLSFKPRRTMKTTTTITRDSNYSFIKVTAKEDGTSFTRKLEKGTTDYSNACSNFHKNNTAIEIGNSVSLTY